MIDFIPSRQHSRTLNPETAYSHYVLDQHWVFMDPDRMQYLTASFMLQSHMSAQKGYYDKWRAFKKVLDLHTPEAIKSLRKEVIEIRRKTNPD